MSFPRRQFDVISACRQYNLPRDVSSSTDSTTLTLYNGEGSFYTETARGRWSRDRISRQRSAVAERRYFAAMNLNLLLDGHFTVATTVLKLNKIYFK